MTKRRDIAVFVPYGDQAPARRPASLPLGRLALSLEGRGTRVIFCRLEDVLGSDGGEVLVRGWRVSDGWVAEAAGGQMSRQDFRHDSDVGIVASQGNPVASNGRPTGSEAGVFDPQQGSSYALDGCQTGSEAGWVAVESHPVSAGYMRVAPLKAQGALPEVARLFQELGLPLVNTPHLTPLCRDKLRWNDLAQENGLPVPDAVGGLPSILAHLDPWGGGFLKPRFGARGRDVVRLVVEASGGRVWIEGETTRGPGLEAGGEKIRRGANPERRVDCPATGRVLEPEDFRRWLEGREALEPQILQKEVVLPPGPWTGLSIRSLVQRDRDGVWKTTVPVVRASQVGVAGNVSAGAGVEPLELSAASFGGRPAREVLEQVFDLDRLIMSAIDKALGIWAPLAVEVGIDYVPDEEGRLHGIEINDTPQGRLSLVAESVARGGEGGDVEKERVQQAFRRALERPVTYLVDPPEMLREACSRIRQAVE